MNIIVSANGRVHRVECSHNGVGGRPNVRSRLVGTDGNQRFEQFAVTDTWKWAQDQPREKVLLAVIEHGYAICQHCRPFSLERDAQQARESS